MPVRLTGDSIGQLAIVTKSITAEVSVTATTSATGNTCLAFGSQYYQGGTYLVVVYTPYITKGTTNIDIELYDGTTFLTALSGHLTASTVHPGGDMLAFVALTGGNHTLKVTAFVDGGTGKFGAGDGATGDNPPAVGFVLPIA